MEKKNIYVKKIIYLHSGLEDDIGGPHATVIL
jgi:hypothetical protein